MASCQYLLHSHFPATETTLSGNTCPIQQKTCAWLLRTSWRISFARYVTLAYFASAGKTLQNRPNNVDQTRSFQISHYPTPSAPCLFPKTMSYVIMMVNSASINPKKKFGVLEVGVIPLVSHYLRSRRTAWVPGQGVRIDYSAIIEILIQQLDGQR
jgi:hypothetical protein